MNSRLNALVVLIGVASFADAAEPTVSYQREIQPLLSDACYQCHGPDGQGRKGGLRLDQFESAVAPADSGRAAVVPTHPDQSEMIRRILSNDPNERMPPPSARRQLTSVERRKLQDWIVGGAAFDRHWSFQPIRRPAIPEVDDRDWCRTPIDRFVRSKLAEITLKPADGATATTVLRRLSFGLTGLPPAQEEVSQLLATKDAAETERLLTQAIERRLVSTRYGEHWARHWMDLARYADSAGYELDYPFHHSWRYRDWLIRSFQSNKPLDRFLQEQIAGDQLWPDSEDAREGTLFLAIGPRRFEGGIQRPNEREYEWFTDLTDTMGSAFLGLTLGCARCHDHKFDAVTQKDYFGIQSIFGDSRLEEKRVVDKGETSPVVLRVVRRDQPAALHILRRGEIENPISPAISSLPAVLTDGGAIDVAGQPQQRAALARWLTSAEQPLTARVMANRVWMWHFGKGLVRTPSDFGVQGERPTHPELLDWLASELIESGWDLNHLHRLILNSATYRMSSTASPDVQDRDPDDRLLTRFPRRRLQAEELQDAMRFVAGRLNLESFGPPIVPPLEEWALAGLRNANWQPTGGEAGANRRGIYMVVRRSMKLPFFEVFNGPDTVNSCAARDSTTIPLQALTMLNSPESRANARGLATLLWNESGGDSSIAAQIAWRSLFGRAIRDEELQIAKAFLGDSTVPAEQPRHGSVVVPAVWIAWTQVLMNSSEFSYVD